MNDNLFKTVDVTQPPKNSQFCRIYRDVWWWCKGGDPTKALVYFAKKSSSGAAQCNKQRELLTHYKEMYEGCEPVFIELGFLHFEPSGY